MIRTVVAALVAALFIAAPAHAGGRPVVPPPDGCHYTGTGHIVCGRPVLPKKAGVKAKVCKVVSTAEVVLIDTLLPARAGRVVTATTTQCVFGNGIVVYDTAMDVVKFTDPGGVS